MKLADLVPADAPVNPDFAELQILGITADSRRVRPGDVFVAVPGSKDDGLRYVHQAIAAGAVAIMAERLPAQALPNGVAFIKVENVRRALAVAAAHFFPQLKIDQKYYVDYQQLTILDKIHLSHSSLSRRPISRHIYS